MVGFFRQPENLSTFSKRVIELIAAKRFVRGAAGYFCLRSAGWLCSVPSLWGRPPVPVSAASGIALCYGISRINEIAYAFYRDALTLEKGSDLTAFDRIRMAMRSYFGLSFNFSLLYYFLPLQNLFNCKLAGYFQAFYFSGVTLATLGYGDIYPVRTLPRLLALYPGGRAKSPIYGHLKIPHP